MAGKVSAIVDCKADGKHEIVQNRSHSHQLRMANCGGVSFIKFADTHFFMLIHICMIYTDYHQLVK